jgi:hypothetical protein
VWPFETGLTTDPTGGSTNVIVHAEIWPSASAVDLTRHPVKDAAQVICLCARLADLDARGDLAAHFAPDLDAETARVVIDEEGWVLAADHPQREGRRPM